MDSPDARIIAQATTVISMLQTWDSLWAHWILEMGVSPVAPRRRRCATQQHISATGHPMGCPVRPQPMYLPMTSFFCVLKIRLTKLALLEMCWRGFVVLYGKLTNKNWTLQSLKGCFLVFVPPLQYIYLIVGGRKVDSLLMRKLGQEGGVKCMGIVYREGADYGRSRFHLLVGSNLEYQLKVDLAHVFVWGSLSPMEEKNCPIEKSYCLTERFLMRFPPTDSSLAPMR